MKPNGTDLVCVSDPFFKDRISFEDLIAICPDAIIGIDRKGIIHLLNPAAERLIGYNADQSVGCLSITRIYLSEKSAREIKRQMYAPDMGGKGRLVDYETRLRHKEGREIPILLSAALIFREGKEIGSVGFFHDMSVRKDMEKRLRKLSITDSLTGLYNQRHFHACLSREIERTGRYRRPLSLICFDLDHFKECNDAMGHQEGDNVLRLVGQVLKKEIRKSDLSFRYGGDEFFVLLPETDTKSAQTAAEKIRKTFKHRWPYDSVSGSKRTKPVTLSMGVASAAYGEPPEGIVKRADLAMYEAKKHGGDQIRVADFTPDEPAA